MTNQRTSPPQLINPWNKKIEIIIQFTESEREIKFVISKPVCRPLGVIVLKEKKKKKVTFFWLVDKVYLTEILGHLKI